MIGDNYNNSKGSSQPHASNQMQPSGNLPCEFNANAPNSIQSNRTVTPHFSLGNGIFDDESNQNPVSTGLRLSYEGDEEQQSSSITSIASSVFSSIGYDIRTEFDRRREEIDRFIQSQEESMASLKHKHLDSLTKALEKGAAEKIQEKDVELAKMTRKNQELAESLKQVTARAQTWCNWAKHNESLIHGLKNNIRKAIEHSNNRAKEGYGESDFDAADSYVEDGKKMGIIMVCRACGAKEASVLLMPCKHLCLCKDCGEGCSFSACPLCFTVTSDRFELYFS